MGMVTATRTRSAPAPATSPAPPMLRALRGATTVCADDKASIGEAVTELLRAIVDANGIAPAQVLSAIFSATGDLRSLYPAAAARALGWHEVPMLCVREMDVDDAPPRCVRVLLHLAVERDAALRPVYLHGARVLRPDLLGR